jgi:hypothetical protein
MMTTTDYNAPAELYLGADWKNAHQQGSRAFRTAAQAIRFALEEAAPVSLRGALLTVGGRAFSSNDMKEFYRSREYPLPRK